MTPTTTANATRIDNLEFKMHQLEASHLGLRQKVFTIEKDLQEVKIDIGSIKKTQDAIFDMLGKINEKMDGIKGTVESIVNPKIDKLIDLIVNTNKDTETYIHQRIQTLENSINK